MLLIDYDSIAYNAGCCESVFGMRIRTDTLMSQIVNQCGDSQVLGWVERVSGKSNFRKHVATTTPYKGSRRGEKPELLNEAKQYAVDTYGIKWAPVWLESEDMIGIALSRLPADANVTIIRIDKDLNQFGGKFYNWQKDLHETITEFEAERYLCAQFLTGDSTDDIPGLFRYGPKTAAKILDCPREEWYTKIALEYIKNDKTYEYLTEQCRLLYLLRSYSDVYNYPLSRDQYNELSKEVYGCSETNSQ